MKRAGSLLLLSMLAFGMLPITAARAFCMVQPFDQVIRQADAVLVATVADAQVGPHGLILRLDVEQTLKGSPPDGERVRFASCGVMISRQTERRWGRQMIGERGFYILSGHPGSTFRMYGEITEPAMKTLEERIARAVEVLGVTVTLTPTPGATATQPATPTPSTPTSDGGTWWIPWVLLLGIVVATRAVVLLARRRRRNAAED